MAEVDDSGRFGTLAGKRLTPGGGFIFPISWFVNLVLE